MSGHKAGCAYNLTGRDSTCVCGALKDGPLHNANEGRVVLLEDAIAIANAAIAAARAEGRAEERARILDAVHDLDVRAGAVSYAAVLAALIGSDK